MRFIRSAAFLAAVVLPASLLAQKQSVTAPGMNATATLTPGIRAGNILYVSGQLGTSRDAPDSTIQGQTKRALENVQKIVEAAGSTMANVFLADVKDFAGMNSAYTQAFPKEPPARSTVAVAALVSPAAKVEIECIAAVPGK
jgi:reactive intermediate/imine deaminase